MSIDEATLRAMCVRFQNHALTRHLSLSASRDLLTKSLWEDAYPPVMKRARDGKLDHWSLEAQRLVEVASAFRVEPAPLQAVLLQSIPALDALREAIRHAMPRGSARVAIVGKPGPARDAVAALCIQEMAEVLGKARVFRVLHGDELDGRQNLTWNNARHTPVPRASGADAAEELRRAIRVVQRMDCDAVGYMSIRSPAAAREVGSLIAGSRWTFLVAEDAQHIVDAMAAAGLAEGPEVFARVVGNDTQLLPRASVSVLEMSAD